MKTFSGDLSETKSKLLNAGVNLMRTRGFNATTVDDICREAGVTKGGFFHYFKSKDDIARAAATYFFEESQSRYAQAAFRKASDPLDRIFGRLDFAKTFMGTGKPPSKGCLLGMFAQELAYSDPEMRSVCQIFFSQMTADFSRDLSEAKALYAPKADFDPMAVAKFYLALVQGTLMLAKAEAGNEILHANIEQFRTYLKLLLVGSKPKAKAAAKARA